MEQLILAPEQRRPTILSLLRSARREIILSLFRCDDSRVLDEIVMTARRKIDVRVLVTPKARGWNKRLGSLVTLLKDTGVDVAQYSGPWTKYHAKYLVVDGETAAVASMNLTRKCLDETCDFVLITREAEIVSGLRTLFDFDLRSPEAALPEIGERLIVAPDESRRRMLDILDSAKHSIRVIDHRCSHPDVLLLIAKKIREGVHVRVLGRGEVGEMVSHGKLILIDSSLAIIGSASLSRPGLDVRREVSVIIRDRKTIEALSAYFETLAAAPVATNTEVIEDEDEEE
jgi:cardiolipin synthase